MQTGFAMLCAGSIRAKNVRNGTYNRSSVGWFVCIGSSVNSGSLVREKESFYLLGFSRFSPIRASNMLQEHLLSHIFFLCSSLDHAMLPYFNISTPQ